jgi:hypothetical protein
MLRKNIFFRESHWLILHAFMHGKGIDSPSLAIEVLLTQLLQQESVNDCRNIKTAH